MEIRLAGRTALITGGSKGLGLATAIKFAEAGAHVAILARNAESLDAAKGLIDRTGETAAAAFPCDVTDPAAIERGYEAAMSAFGKIDILSTTPARRRPASSRRSRTQSGRPISTSNFSRRSGSPDWCCLR